MTTIQHNDFQFPGGGSQPNADPCIGFPRVFLAGLPTGGDVWEGSAASTRTY